MLDFSRKKLLVLGLLALFLCAVASGAWAKTYSQILVFGDSLSDDGSNVHKFTNDKVWAQYLAEKMGIAAGDLINKAASGAKTEDLKNAVAAYAAQNTIDGDKALVAIWIGGNDIRAALEKVAAYQVEVSTAAANQQSEIFQTGYQNAMQRAQTEGVQLTQAMIQEEVTKIVKAKIQQYAGELVQGELLNNIKNNIVPSIRLLGEKGARDFIFLNIPNIGSTPGVKLKGTDTVTLASGMTAGFNDLYYGALKQTFLLMGTQYAFQFYNVYGFLDGIITTEEGKAPEARTFKLPPDFYFATELAGLKAAAATPGSSVFTTAYTNTVPLAMAQGITIDPNPAVNMGNAQFMAIFQVEAEKVVLAELNKIVMANAPVLGRDADTYIFWDLLHPTSKAHELLAADVHTAITTDAGKYPNHAKVDSEIAGGPCFIDSATSPQHPFPIFLGLLGGCCALLILIRRNRSNG